MNPRSRTNWTRDDEQRFQEMAKQREEILAKNRQPIADLVSDLLASTRADGVIYKEPIERRTEDFIIKNAERIRDALDPYDSGTRPEKVMDSVAPVKPLNPSREQFYIAVTKVKDKYDASFCRLIIDTFGARAKKMAQIDESRWAGIIGVCDDILSYAVSYPVLHETNPQAWETAMKNLFNRHIQKLGVGDVITQIDRHFDEFVVSTDQCGPITIKNFGDL